MKEITKVLKDFDNILRSIASKQEMTISEIELQKNNAFKEEQILYLIDEGLVIRTKAPVHYKISQKGIVFISQGGYQKANRNLIVNRTSNIVYLVASPLIALISVTISIFTFIYTNNNTKELICNELKKTNSLISYEKKQDSIHCNKKLSKICGSNKDTADFNDKKAKNDIFVQ